jgi:hypothetical protein
MAGQRPSSKSDATPLEESSSRKTGRCDHDFCQTSWQNIKGGSLQRSEAKVRQLFLMNLKWIAVFGFLGLLGGVLVLLAPWHWADSGTGTPFVALSHVPVPEFPAKAAGLVHAASPSNRDQTVMAVVEAVNAIARPGVLPYVVTAICQSDPEETSAVVRAAITAQPESVLVVTRAALSIAPGRVEQVVYSACLADPASFAIVGIMTYRQMPGAGESILAGLVKAIPGLKAYIEEAEIEVGNRNVEEIAKLTGELVRAAGSSQAR